MTSKQTFGKSGLELEVKFPLVEERVSKADGEVAIRKYSKGRFLGKV